MSFVINPYRFAAGAADTGLLADYPGAAAAFSLRELTSAWAGLAVVEVRRAGGSPATADFTAAEVADGTLTTWTGVNDGFVSKWYDQSGNGFNATQATTGDQPKIVNAGTLVTANGEPAIDFDGINHYLFNAASLTYNGGVSWYAVADLTGVDATPRRLWGDDITGAQGYNVFYSFGESGFSVNDNDTGYKITPQTDHALVQELSSFNFDDTSGDYEYARDGSNTTGTVSSWTGPIDSSNTANVGVMGSGNGNQLQDGKLQELIIYPNDQSANRTGIEGDINTHYSIY